MSNPGSAPEPPPGGERWLEGQPAPGGPQEPEPPQQSIERPSPPEQPSTPPPTNVETTSPLPAVPAGTQSEHATVGLPLLDLLAPEQMEQRGPQPPGGYPEQAAGFEHGSAYPPQAGYPRQPGPSNYLDSPHQEVGPPGLSTHQLLSGYPDSNYQQGGYPDQGQQAGYPGPGAFQQPGYAEHGGYGQPSGYPPYQQAPGKRTRRPRGAAGRWSFLERPGAKIVLALAVGVLVLALISIWVISTSQPKRRAAAPTTSAPTTSAVRVAGGYQFTQSAARSDTDCSANAYGKVAEFFKSTPCASLDRALYTSTVDGQPTVVSVSVVTMPSEQAATDLKKVTDANGTGNVADLLRAGVQVPGGPDKLTDAGYASTRDGAKVIIAEADYADAAVSNEDQLDAISEAALRLRK